MRGHNAPCVSLVRWLGFLQGSALLDCPDAPFAKLFFIMKNPRLHFSRGFTLIELLVVIAIIAVLAAAGFGAGSAAINKARKAKALATATALDQAVNLFYTEYSSLPLETADTADTVTKETASSGLNLLKELMGTDDSVANTKRIKFLSVKEGKGNKDGMIYSASGDPQALFDPWGGDFRVFLDGDYNEKLQVPAASGNVVLNNRRVATMTMGADKATGAGKMNDDVKTY